MGVETEAEAEVDHPVPELGPGKLKIGLDLVEVARVERLIDRWGERFLERLFTPAELDYARARRRPGEHLAARLAAKEALIKAWGRPLRWREIEVATAPSGEPFFSRLPAELASWGVRLSLSHTGGLAAAVVLLFRGKRGAPRRGAAERGSPGGARG